MRIDFEKIRGEIYAKYNISLPPDDPVLIAVALNESVLNHYIELVSMRYESANRELTAHLQQHVEQSKEAAARMIADAAGHVAEEVRQSTVAATRDVAVQLRKQISDARAVSSAAANSARGAQRAKNDAVMASVLAGASAIVAVAAVVVVLFN